MNFGSLSDTYVTLNKNNQNQTVTLEIIGDNNYEDNEDLWLDATVVSKTDLDEVRTESGYGEILNDDEKIVKKDITFYLGGASNTEGGALVFDLEISDVLDKDINIELGTTSSSEGDSGVQTTGIEVYLSGGSLSQDITIDLSSGDSVTIPSGSTSTTAQVAWLGDTKPYPTNNFNLYTREVA